MGNIRLIQTYHYPKLTLTTQQALFISAREKIEAALLDTECTGFNIILSEQIIGFILIKRFMEDSVFLWNMIIDVKYQKLGFGKYSLHLLIDRLKLEGIHAIITTCLFQNRVALEFYVKAGFKQFETIAKDDIDEINLIIHIGELSKVKDV